MEGGPLSRSLHLEKAPEPPGTTICILIFPSSGAGIMGVSLVVLNFVLHIIAPLSHEVTFILS